MDVTCDRMYVVLQCVRELFGLKFKDGRDIYSCV